MPSAILSSSSISIHALLAESDSFTPEAAGAQRNFYPRSPCGERPVPLISGFSFEAFLSTLSLRRATLRKVPLLGIK